MKSTNLVMTLYKFSIKLSIFSKPLHETANFLSSELGWSLKISSKLAARNTIFNNNVFKWLYSTIEMSTWIRPVLGKVAYPTLCYKEIQEIRVLIIGS